MGAESYTKYVSVTEKGTKEVLGEFKKILPPLEGKKILDAELLSRPFTSLLFK